MVLIKQTQALSWRERLTRGVGRLGLALDRPVWRSSLLLGWLVMLGSLLYWYGWRPLERPVALPAAVHEVASIDNETFIAIIRRAEEARATPAAFSASQSFFVE
ncbi:MAG TPA: hypothetical protein VJC05_04120 [Candidatus Andersenbacteria bacterium]|nr:hypothetical protein [Candidatus Andersenbacteria bacterium]